jgi:type I restriction enzyme S subunit
VAVNMSKLGEYVELSEYINKPLKYTVEDVRGISIKKMFIPTKADMDGVPLHNYLVIYPKYFCYVTVTSRNGGKISLAYNSTDASFIVSSSYVSFYVKDENNLIPEYLFMYFNRPEFDRYSRFNSWGSAREAFSFEDLCDIDIEVPPIDIQRKYVNVYLAMVKNQKAYERGLDDLKLTCDAYIEKLRREILVESLAKYIEPISRKSADNKIDFICGVESTGKFMNTKAIMDGIATNRYEVISEREFAYNPSRINLGSIALCEKQCIVSPMYVHFGVKQNAGLIPEYLEMWFARKEFQRSTLFYAMGSVRDTFGFDLMQEVKIPIPDIKIQQYIISVFNSYEERKLINELLKNQINEICPILINGSIYRG